MAAFLRKLDDLIQLFTKSCLIAWSLCRFRGFNLHNFQVSVSIAKLSSGESQMKLGRAALLLFLVLQTWLVRPWLAGKDKPLKSPAVDEENDSIEKDQGKVDIFDEHGGSKNVTLPEMCVLQKRAGSGNQCVVRYYYDHGAKKCLPFFFGKIGGNANNFTSVEECVEKCIDAPRRAAAKTKDVV
ncbi:MAG: Collagen type VI alpha 3 [Marteilia pararefringens]